MKDYQATDRILGWDLLRGLSAFAVMAYHLTYWMELAHWPSIGTHAVYVFFVLSGASLAYSYALKRCKDDFSWLAFFWARYWRLAPLFLLLLVPMVIGRIATGQTDRLAERLIWNLTFTFGLSQPGVKSLLVGGWSLGIEFVFYAMFPAMLWLLASPKRLLRTSTPSQLLGFFLLAGVLALVAQWVWVEHIWRAATFAGTAHLPQTQMAYHHAPSFLGYFVSGVAWGVCLRSRAAAIVTEPSAAKNMLALCCVALSFILIACTGSDNPYVHLWGWRGAFLSAVVMCAVVAATVLVIPVGLRKVTILAGDATYGVYLIHPVVYFAVERAVVPLLKLQPIVQWDLLYRVSLGAAIVVLSFALAVLSERRYEKPLRSFMGSALRKWMTSGVNSSKLG